MARWALPCGSWEFFGGIFNARLAEKPSVGRDGAELKLGTKRDTLLQVCFRPLSTPFLRCSKVHALSFVTGA